MARVSTPAAPTTATKAPEAPDYVPKTPNYFYLVPTAIPLGCDPEFFFSKEGEVVGAEKVLPPKPIAVGYLSNTRFVLDGVQVELNPAPYTCRESLCGEIGLAFRSLRAHLATLKDVKASFTTCIDLSKAELDSLSDAAKVLGCAPSLNRGDTADKKSAVTIDGASTLKRSAGGHLHLGLTGNPSLMKDRETLVDLLDVLVGSTCVLLDRDPNAAERRKVYGRAGEYRLPAHGLEYRTLSNFWLRSYQLTSFVLGAARAACYVLNTTQQQSQYQSHLRDSQRQLKGVAQTYGAQYEASYRSTVDNYAAYLWDPTALIFDLIGGREAGLKRIREVINTNDREGALETWKQLEPFILKLHLNNTGFNSGMLPNFAKLVEAIDKKGIEAVFPIDPIEHWSNLHTGGHGWESFISDRLGHFSPKSSLEGRGVCA